MPCFVVVLFSVFMPTCFLCLYAYLFFTSLCLLVFVFCFLSLCLLLRWFLLKGLSDHPARWTSCKQEQVAGAQARKVERCVKSKLQNCNRGPLLTNTDQLQSKHKLRTFRDMSAFSVFFFTAIIASFSVKGCISVQSESWMA